MDTISNAQRSVFTRYGFAWVTLALFLFSLVLHWVFGWLAFVNEQHSLHQPVLFHDFAIEILRDTFENWQSEFLQLIWQVAGLALLLHLGSPQSKEGDDRMEAKLDLLIEKLDPEEGRKLVRQIDDLYSGRHTDLLLEQHRRQRKAPQADG